MSPEIFIEDFERTENSDSLHGVIGRSLIIATRFDSMCISLSKLLDIRSMVISKAIGSKLVEQGAVEERITDENFDTLINQVTSKYHSLGASIKSFQLPGEASTILHDARKARNEIAHSLTKGLEGCIDSKVNEEYFINEISRLVKIITDGDIIISSLMSVVNKEPILNESSLSKYRNRVLNWVVEE